MYMFTKVLKFLQVVSYQEYHYSLQTIITALLFLRYQIGFIIEIFVVYCINFTNVRFGVLALVSNMVTAF
jgi:hypothetical protein